MAADEIAAFIEERAAVEDGIEHEADYVGSRGKGPYLRALARELRDKFNTRSQTSTVPDNHTRDAERLVLEAALFGGEVRPVSAECMEWVQRIALRVKDAAEKEWESGYSDGVDGYNREKARADEAERRAKTMEQILGIVKRYAEVMGIVEIGHAITAASVSLDNHEVVDGFAPIVLTPEAFAKMMEMIESPAAPTEALKALFREKK